MITGIAHVCYGVADLERALRFYRDALGLEPAFDFKRDTGERYGCYLGAGGRNFIELFVGQVEPPIKGQSYRHLCLEVDDIQDTVRTLRERGLEVTDPKLGMDQTWQAWLADPDGNRIELHAYTPQSWQAPHLK